MMGTFFFCFCMCLNFCIQNSLCVCDIEHFSLGPGHVLGAGDALMVKTGSDSALLESEDTHSGSEC